MKKYLALLAAITMILGSCAKKQEASESDPPNTIKINGVLYPTVSIAGKTWTSRNYNGAGGWNFDTLPDDTLNGKLYTQAEAKAIVLPKGWRLPSQADYNTLLQFALEVGDAEGHYYNNDQSTPQILMSTSNWTNGSGTNTSGFNAYPAGYFTSRDGSALFMDRGQMAMFVTSSVYPSGDSYGPGIVWISLQSSNVSPQYSAGEDFGDATSDQRGSVRFVKDN
ncbi:MAG: FISUMP domain-containing protein [Mucilaginibacter sp.]